MAKKVSQMLHVCDLKTGKGNHQMEKKHNYIKMERKKCKTDQNGTEYKYTSTYDVHKTKDR